MYARTVETTKESLDNSDSRQIEFNYSSEKTSIIRRNQMCFGPLDTSKVPDYAAFTGDTLQFEFFWPEPAEPLYTSNSIVCKMYKHRRY